MRWKQSIFPQWHMNQASYHDFKAHRKTWDRKDWIQPWFALLTSCPELLCGGSTSISAQHVHQAHRGTSFASKRLDSIHLFLMEGDWSIEAAISTRIVRATTASKTYAISALASHAHSAPLAGKVAARSSCPPAPKTAWESSEEEAEEPRATNRGGSGKRWMTGAREKRPKLDRIKTNRSQTLHRWSPWSW